MSAITLAKHISKMTMVLNEIEFSAAVKILTHLIDKNSAIPLKRAIKVSQLSNDQWEECKAEILEFFEIDGDNIFHKAVLECRIKPLITNPKPKKGQTATLPFDEPDFLDSPRNIVHPPDYILKQRQPEISIKKTAYDVAKQLYRQAGKTDNAAGTFISGLFKKWSEGDVYEAIQHCHVKSLNEYVDNPAAWMTGYLQNKDKKPHANNNSTTIRAPIRKNNKLTTPKNLGVSEGLADEIREMNQRLNVRQFGKYRAQGSTK